MKGRQFLTRSEDFDRVYRHKAAWTSGLIVMRAARNDLDISRYGFSINKKVGDAVARNKVRRRLREIMRNQRLRPGWDIVLIVRPAAAAVAFEDLRRIAENLLTRAKILEPKTDEIPGFIIN